MHSLLKWKEVPIDVLLLAIYCLPLYFLKEIKHGKAGIGSYALRAEQRSYSITVQEIPDLTVCSLENIIIIESIKNKTLSTEPIDGKMDIPLSREEEIIKSGKLVFSPQLGTFTVMGFSDLARMVRLYATEYCSCVVKTTSYHKIAVKKRIGLAIETRCKIKPTELKRKRKPKGEGKSGRKRPRANDYEICYPSRPREAN